VFKFAAFIFGGLLLFLTGCTSVYQGSEAQPPPEGWSETNVVIQPMPVPAPRPPAVKPVPARQNIVRPAPILTWTSLDRWAAENKLAAPRKIPNSPVTAYAVGSQHGTMVLGIGSREATWNGVELNLGFPPEIIDNQVFVYGLDLQKNLEPLLLGQPLAFGTNRVIVLDPGHGGANSGTICVLDGRPEKEFTLDLARQLKPLLETNGWTVFLTRTADVDDSLSNRVAFAEAHHANCFISLHFNSAAPDRTQAGLETYCMTPTGMPSTLTRNYSDVWSDHYPNNDFDEANLLLAVRLQAAVLRATGEEDRGIRRARFMGVLEGQKRPAVLIEGGYLSNPQEAKRIENPEFRQKIAEAIAGALK
jgi:N-acetylmuramoyl-L-alanine amidase